MKHRLALLTGAVLLGSVMVSASSYAQMRFGPRAHMALVGTVTAVNTTANTITIQPTFRLFATTVTVSVPATAQIVRFSSTTLAGLKQGDEIRVNGLPLAIQAASILATTPPAPLAGTGGTSGTGGTTTPPPAPRASAFAVATVVSVDTTKNQISATLADGTPITINVPAGIQIQRRDNVALSAVQVGDLAQAFVSYGFGAVQPTLVQMVVTQPPAPPATGTTGGTTPPPPPAG